MIITKAPLCDSLVEVYFNYRVYKTILWRTFDFLSLSAHLRDHKVRCLYSVPTLFLPLLRIQSIPVIFSPDESITSITLLSDVTQTTSFLCKELSPAALSWYTRASGEKTWFPSHMIMVLQRSEEQNSDFKRLHLGTSLLRGQARVQNLQYELIS